MKRLHKFSVDQAVVLHRRYWHLMSMMAHKHKEPNPKKVIRQLGYNPKKLVRYNFLCTYSVSNVENSMCTAKWCAECKHCPIKFTEQDSYTYRCHHDDSVMLLYYILMNELMVYRRKFNKWDTLESVCYQIAELPVNEWVMSK